MVVRNQCFDKYSEENINEHATTHKKNVKNKRETYRYMQAQSQLTALLITYKQFDDTKVVIRSPLSQNDRQCNDQKPSITER